MAVLFHPTAERRGRGPRREVIRLKKAIVPILLAAMACAGETGARTWYVYPGGAGGDAPTIQAAVDSAAASGDKILLKGGVYREGGIVVDGKNVAIDQFDGQAYLHAPAPGTGVCVTARNVGSGFALNAVAFRGFETAIALENASGYVQWPSVRACGRAVTVSGASSAPTVWFALVDSCGTGVEVNGGSAVVLQNLTIVHCAAGVAFRGGSATLARSIVYGCENGVSCTGGAASLSCNDLFLNGVDYSGCAPGGTDFYTDPIFCFAAASSPVLYWLHESSPCLTGSNPCGLRCGALTQAAGCTGTAVEGTSWGVIKAIYR